MSELNDPTESRRAQQQALTVPQDPDSESGEVPSSDEELREVSVLAAAHAALDRATRDARGDIVCESVLRALHLNGALQVERVVVEVAKLWRTTKISRVLIESAVQDAHAAGLVVEQNSLFGEPRWQLSDEAARDVEEDTRWACHVLNGFNSEAIARLEDDPERVLLRDDRLPKLVESVRAALAVGAQGLYGLEPGSSRDSLRPVAYNEGTALEALAGVQPRPARRACERLLIEALNPDDSFGDDFLSLLAAGNVLHGIVTRRDVQPPPELSGCRLAFDTSAIVDLADPEGPLSTAVIEMIAVSLSLGVEVVVAHHVVEEWRRLFAAADDEMAHAADQAGGLGALSILVQNPFISGFHSSANVNPELTWKEYSEEWADPRQALVGLGVKLRPHGNTRAEDRAFVDEMSKELRRMNRVRGGDDGPRRKLRRPEAIEVDAESAAMVRRWRERSTPDRAFIIARDRMTSTAYRNLRPEDRVPLAVTSQAWLLLSASLLTEDTARQSEVAKIVGNAALRDSFLSLASCYTYEEVVEFGHTLESDSQAPDVRDVAEIVQGILDGFEEEANRADRLADVRLRGARILESRAARRSQRARRALEIVDDKVSEAVGAVQSQATLDSEAQRIRSEAEKRELIKSVEESDRSLEDATKRVGLYGRLAIAGPLVVLAIVGAVLAWRSGELDPDQRKLQLILVGLLAAGAVGGFVVNGARRAVYWTGGIVGISIAGNVLAELITPT